MGSGGPPRPSTIYFYIGLDCGEDNGRCLEAGGGSGAGLVVVDDPDPSSPRRSLLVRGAHPQSGGFELEATVAAPTRDGGGPFPEGEEDVGLALAFLGKRGAVIADMKQEVEKLLGVHRRTGRSAAKKKGELARGAFVLPNKADSGSNVVLVQVKKKRTAVDAPVVPETGRLGVSFQAEIEGLTSSSQNITTSLRTWE